MEIIKYMAALAVVLILCGWLFVVAIGYSVAAVDCTAAMYDPGQRALNLGEDHISAHSADKDDQQAD